MPKLMKAAVALAGGFGVLFGLAALAVPALVSGGLVVRGVSEGYPSWIVLGIIAGGMWSMMLVGTLRRRGSASSQKTPARSLAPPAPDPARD